MTAIRLQEIADCVGAKLQGDPECLILGLATLENAKPSQLSFLISRQYRKYLEKTAASAVLLTSSDADLCPVNALIADNPRLCLAKIARLFEKSNPNLPGIHPTAVIGPGCQIPSSVSIGAYSVIGSAVQLGEEVVVGAGTIIGNDCVVGAKTILRPKVTLYDNVRMGENCLIHSGAVLGGAGFGYAHDEGVWIKMPDLGGVEIGNAVEIGANTTVDRGFLEDTKIGHGVIIDNLVQVGHNVTIGDRTAIAACVAIAGSTSIGAYCLIGGAACISGHLEIGDKVSITATSGVNHSINSPGIYSSGLPAKPNHIWRKNAARFQYLDEMAKRIRSLEQVLKAKPLSGTNLNQASEVK